MHELETRTECPSGVSRTGLRMAWVRTADGLQMRWTVQDVAMRPAVVEIDAEPALAA
jgi:hypothetical protein